MNEEPIGKRDLMIRSVIARLVKWYEKVGATSESDGNEQYWRNLMQPDEDTSLISEAVGLGPEDCGDEFLKECDRLQTHGELPGIETYGELPGDESNPGVNRGLEIHGEIGGMERSQGELPEAEVEKLMVSFDLSRAEAERVIRRGLEVEARVLQSGEHEVLIETPAEKTMRQLGPLTWKGVDGWMDKVVVGDGRVWRRGVGWVKLRGRKVTRVIAELRTGREGRGVWRGRRID